MMNTVVRSSLVLRARTLPLSLPTTKSNFINLSQSFRPVHSIRQFHKSIHVISLPVTTRKSYIYLQHNSSLLLKAQINSIPWAIKLENKATGLATKAWTKLNESNLLVNRKIVQFVKKLLDTIPYEENCLKSFPSQSSMIREVNEETLDESLENVSSTSTSLPPAVLPHEIETHNIPHTQLKPIPLYHPSFQRPTVILNQLHDFRDEARAKHLKYALLCGVGVPLSLPFALLPVVPNVPGLYLSYRLYCNIKALLGVKHLDYLLESTGEQSNLQNTNHISFETESKLDEIYKLGNTSKELLVNSVQEEERLVITREIIEKLCLDLDLAHLKEDLYKAMRQEGHRLGKTIKITEEVE